MQCWFLVTMINATRKWLQRNRTNFAIGFGVLGIGYVAGQYVLSKIAEAGERMSSDRTAKEKYNSSCREKQLQLAKFPQFAPALSTKPGRLHPHCSCSYSRRSWKSCGSAACWKYNKGITAEESRKTQEDNGAVGDSPIRTIVKGSQRGRRGWEEPCELAKWKLCSCESNGSPSPWKARLRGTGFVQEQGPTLERAEDKLYRVHPDAYLTDELIYLIQQ